MWASPVATSKRDGALAYATTAAATTAALLPEKSKRTKKSGRTNEGANMNTENVGQREAHTEAEVASAQRSRRANDPPNGIHVSRTRLHWPTCFVSALCCFFFVFLRVVFVAVAAAADVVAVVVVAASAYAH